MAKPELKIKASVLPIAELALGIADKILVMVLSWSENSDKRGDQKAIKYAKRIHKRVRELEIEDKHLTKYCDLFINSLD
jgi:hypothetical protein